MYIEQIIFYNHIIFYTKGRNNKRDLSSIDEINKKKEEEICAKNESLNKKIRCSTLQMHFVKTKQANT